MTEKTIIKETEVPEEFKDYLEKENKKYQTEAEMIQATISDDKHLSV